MKIIYSLQYRIGEEQQTVPINKDVGEVTVGREGTDIIIPHELVSRNHASFFYTSGKLLLQDNKSTNGTCVHHRRINENYGISPNAWVQLEPEEAVQIFPNTKIRFGELEATIVQEIEEDVP